MLKIYHDMLESNMIGSKSTMIRSYAKELASVYPFETNAQAIDLAEKLFLRKQPKDFMLTWWRIRKDIFRFRKV